MIPSIRTFRSRQSSILMNTRPIDLSLERFYRWSCRAKRPLGWIRLSSKRRCSILDCSITVQRFFIMVSPICLMRDTVTPTWGMRCALRATSSLSSLSLSTTSMGIKCCDTIPIKFCPMFGWPPYAEKVLVSKALVIPRLLVDSPCGIFEGETLRKLLLLEGPPGVMKLFVSWLFFPLLELVAAVDWPPGTIRWSFMSELFLILRL